MGIELRLPVKLPKKGRREEDKTIFILSCDDRVAIVKRAEQGLLAGLWQFPEAPGILQLDAALTAVQNMGLTLREVYRQADKKHIFTHIQWNMRGFYLEVSERNEKFTWMTRDEIETQTALPTAFRQFWDAT
jgi:A/G-specific adenine glycosylase